MHRNDDHHDNRYEDGDFVTGTVADYDEDWLSEDGEWLRPLRTFEVRLWLDTWQGREIPSSYLGDKRFIRAESTSDAARIAGQQWPHAWRIVTKEVAPC